MVDIYGYFMIFLRHSTVECVYEPTDSWEGAHSPTSLNIAGGEVFGWSTSQFYPLLMDKSTRTGWPFFWTHGFSSWLRKQVLRLAKRECNLDVWGSARLSAEGFQDEDRYQLASCETGTTGPYWDEVSNLSIVSNFPQLSRWTAWRVDTQKTSCKDFEESWTCCPGFTRQQDVGIYG